MKSQSFASTKEYQTAKPTSDSQNNPYVKADLVYLFNRALSDGALRLFLILKHYGWKSGQCFTGQERLAEDMGLKPRQIRNLLAEIEAFEMVEKQARPGRSNLYALADTTPKVQAEPESDPGKKLPPPRQKIAYEEEQLKRPINTVCESAPTPHIPNNDLIEKEPTAQAVDNTENMGYVALVQTGISPRRAAQLVKLVATRHAGNQVEVESYILKVVKAARSTTRVKNLAGYIIRLIEDEVQPNKAQNQPAKSGQQKPTSKNHNPIDFAKFGPGGKYGWVTSKQTLN